MKTFKLLLIQTAFLLIITSCIDGGKTAELVAPDTTAAVEKKVNSYGLDPSLYRLEEGVVKKGQFFSVLMQDLGVSLTEANAVADCAKGHFDLRNLRVGRSYKAYYTLTDPEKLAWLAYEQDARSFVLFGLQDSLHVRCGEYHYRLEQKQASLVLENSLWEDMQRAGLSTQLIIKLSSLYTWTIDFFGLQKGDAFIVVYDELVMEDSGAAELGHIKAAVFTHGGKSFQAYRFEQDSIPGYWNEKGENLKKAFRKAPLDFFRISSGFSYARRHPVLRMVRPHTGVDYAAPKGTPVMSIGEGRVVEKGYKGGGGHTVKIKHNNTYTTAYLHLSKYAAGLAVGKHVAQGEVIGYVGSSGLSTGPHLDFRVWKDGKPINPLTMEAPPAEPLNTQNMELFREHIKSMEHALEADYYVKKAEELLQPLIQGK